MTPEFTPTPDPEDDHDRDIYTLASVADATAEVARCRANVRALLEPLRDQLGLEAYVAVSDAVTGLELAVRTEGAARMFVAMDGLMEGNLAGTWIEAPGSADEPATESATHASLGFGAATAPRCVRRASGRWREHR